MICMNTQKDVDHDQVYVFVISFYIARTMKHLNRSFYTSILTDISKDEKHLSHWKEKHVAYTYVTLCYKIQTTNFSGIPSSFKQIMHSHLPGGAKFKQ